MTNSVEKIAKTVGDAVRSALMELKAQEDEVDIQVIEEGSKGLLGLIGNKMARVKVTLRESKSDAAKKFLLDMFNRMDLPVNTDMNEDDEAITVKITGEDLGAIIGRRGETLDALQYLISLVANKSGGKFKRVVVDVENYRQRREESLVRLAVRLADRVKKYNKSVMLEPMNSQERKIVHLALQNSLAVKTYSIGGGQSRRIVIAPKQAQIPPNGDVTRA